ARAAAVAAGEARDLGQGPVEDGAHVVAELGARVEAVRLDVAERLGEELVVAAVRAVDLVRRDEGQDRAHGAALLADRGVGRTVDELLPGELEDLDRKSTRLNSSHVKISYAVFCLKKKKKQKA